MKLAVELLEIGPSTLIDALALETAEGHVIQDTIENVSCVFLPHLRRAEETVAAIIRNLAVGRPSWAAIETDKALPGLRPASALRSLRARRRPSGWR